MKKVSQLLIGAAVLAGGAYIAWRFRHQMREKVAAWLHTHNLKESALMDILIVCDNIGVAVQQKIVCKFFAITQETGEQQISEEIFTPEALEKLYADVYAQLQKQGYVRKSILTQII